MHHGHRPRVPSARTDEDLDAWHHSEPIELLHILTTGSHIESIVDSTHLGGSAILIFQSFHGSGRWLRIGHLEIGGYASRRTGTRRRFQFFLWVKPGCESENLIVDDSREEHLSTPIDHSFSLCCSSRIHVDDPTTID